VPVASGVGKRPFSYSNIVRTGWKALVTGSGILMATKFTGFPPQASPRGYDPEHTAADLLRRKQFFFGLSSKNNHRGHGEHRGHREEV
jgi:hypothetical protein